MFKEFAEFLDNHSYYLNHIMIDKPHVLLIYGVAISHKPLKVLELGIGSGLVTATLLHASIYNNIKTEITAVDNWSQWEGAGKPQHIDQLSSYGVKVIHSEERAFVESAETNYYDLIVVDGDHEKGHEWADKIFKLLSPDGILFSHDILLFPNLKKYIDLAKENNMSYKLFHKSSRPDERCERGFIMIMKNQNE